MQFFLLNSPHNIVIYWFSPLFDWAENFKDLVFVKHFSLFCSENFSCCECGNPRMRNFSTIPNVKSTFQSSHVDIRYFSHHQLLARLEWSLVCLMKIKINVINNESCHSFRLDKKSTAAEYWKISTRNFLPGSKFPQNPLFVFFGRQPANLYE